MSRSYVLGINKYAHSASCALVDANGEVVFALSKERLSRKKYDGGDISSVLRHCLGRFKVRLDEIALVVENCHLFRIDDFERRLRFGVGQYYYPGAYLDSMNLSAEACPIPKMEISHHLAHAYGAMFASPFDRAVVVVMDGMGTLRADLMEEGERYISEGRLHAAHDGFIEVPSKFPDGTQWREAETVYLFDGNELQRLFKRWTRLRSPALLHNYGFENMESLGAVYSRVSSQIFKDWNACGKVMGLAGYGIVRKDHHIMKGPIEDLRVNWPFLDALEPTEGWDHAPDRESNADLAATVQKDLEEITLDFMKRLHDRTDERNLVLTGGVALNSQLNALIAAESAFENVFFPSAPGDNGIALGCAAAGVKHLNKSVQRKKAVALSPYLGCEYSDDEIRASLELNDRRIEFERPEKLLDVVVQAIVDGQVVGWFQGRSEFGPRALGNRSILAHPGLPDMADRVNSQVKFREEFRPFAPAVLADEADEFLVPMRHRSPYMSLAQPVNPQYASRIPAVIHVDGTARLQYLSEGENPSFQALIKRFMSLTGIPMILNTSFNVQGEPIVETPDDAVWTLLNSGMDALAIGPFWVTKREFPSEAELETVRVTARSDLLIETVSHVGGELNHATLHVGGDSLDCDELTVAIIRGCEHPVGMVELMAGIAGDNPSVRPQVVMALQRLFKVGAVEIIEPSN